MDTQDYFSIAFYNVENLFDAEHTDFTLDEDFTPDGKLEWNKEKYQFKLHRIAETIAGIGLNETNQPPVLIGLAEVENDKVLLDLLSQKELAPFNYDFVHYESPDERGVDVAFLYRKDFFELIYSDVYPLLIYEQGQARDYTRDILLICGKLFGEKIYVIINHWPSRSNGKSYTENKRISGAKKVKEIMNQVYEETKDAKVIVMGDFNDSPKNHSIIQLVNQNNLINPMLDMQKSGLGSLIHLGKWHLFDQIMFNKNVLNSDQSTFVSAHIFSPDFLIEKNGRGKGGPFRTYNGSRYVGGYSDHYPVYAIFKKK
ncbi:endonuclease/exonuclease/phosphatase family protein [Namhaeicola litoreus]|uniref:Endonuclease n=1 Tax=Namhaeicola litoreus TaxID=1052145 RepID=A0ABW3Y0G1_9FLAO